MVLITPGPVNVSWLACKQHIRGGPRACRGDDATNEHYSMFFCDQEGTPIAAKRSAGAPAEGGRD